MGLVFMLGIFVVLVIPSCILFVALLIPKASLSLMIVMTFLSIFGGYLSVVVLLFGVGSYGALIFVLLQVA